MGSVVELSDVVLSTLVSIGLLDIWQDVTDRKSGANYFITFPA